MSRLGSFIFNESVALHNPSEFSTTYKTSNTGFARGFAIELLLIDDPIQLKAKAFPIALEKARNL